jgi:DNA-binding MarR family transcriptional regulator
VKTNEHRISVYLQIMRDRERQIKQAEELIRDLRASKAAVVAILQRLHKEN